MRAVEDVIEMPAGSRADFFVELATGSLLRIEDCRPRGPSPAVLEISIFGEFDVEPETRSWDCTGEPLTLPLDGREGLTRLRLTTRPENDDGEPMGLSLFRPQILSPRMKQSPEDRSKTAGLQPRNPPPNVIIYLVDALRSDRLWV